MAIHRAAAGLYLWLAERLYNELAWAYDGVAWLVSLGHWSAWRRAALAHVAGGSVLEVGYGTGALLAEMAGRGWRVIGLERSPAMQRVAGRRLRRAGLNVPRVLGSAAALPIATGTLDAIVSTFPSPYILSPDVLREARRALREPDAASGQPGGRLIIAGLYLETDCGPLRRATEFVFGHEAPDVTQRYAELAADAGLQVRVKSERPGRVWAPVLILESARVPPRDAEE